MKRAHLFEFHDQEWFPASIRNPFTEFMSFFAVSFKPFKPVIPLLAPVLASLDSRQIVDLCSGSGGPAQSLLQMLSLSDRGKELSDVRVLLTDRYPNVEAYRVLEQQYAGAVCFCERPVDARDVPAELSGFRAIFGAFHHFRPEEAEKILADAVWKSRPIGIFEYTERNFLIWGMPLLLTPALIWLCTPLLRFSWSRLLWTYLLSVIPLVGVWDGLVSCLRTYSPDELLQLASAATPSSHAGSYSWKAGRLRSFGACRITYLLGIPAR